MRSASFGTFFPVHNICITCTTKMMHGRFDVYKVEQIHSRALLGSERRVTPSIMNFAAQ
jgi:hypothetical protein